MSSIFSIITVVFNGKDSIGRTINSVLSQKDINIEYIIVDGGSTDGTVELIRSYGSLISKFVTGPDNGIYDAMNKGLAISSGDVVGILNADDYFSHDTVLKNVDRIFSEKNIQAVFGDVAYFLALNPNKIQRHFQSGSFRKDRLSWGLAPAHPALFLRKSVYERFGVFNSKYKIAGDFEFMARIFKNGEVVYRYVPDIFVRMQIGGVSTQGLKSAFTINREIMAACKDNEIPTNFFKLLLRYPLKLKGYLTAWFN